MKYTFKPWEEFLWFCLVSVLPVLLQAMATFDPTAITDYRAWFVSVGAAFVRALGGALLAFVAKLKSSA